MQVINHTPFPAQAFTSFNRDGTTSQVIILRQTLDFASGSLCYSDVQAPLCEADAHFSGVRSGVRQESDFCHSKPRCDILINAIGYAPVGAPSSQFGVRATLRKPATPAPLPLRPQGLNQFDDADPEMMAHWRQALRHARDNPLQREKLIQKTLIVNGPRQFRKRPALARAAQQLAGIATFGLLRLNPWTLTQSGQATTLPLSDDHCYGGSCQSDDGEFTAGKRHRVCAANPFGLGFADQVYLDATRTHSIPAPRIERAGAVLHAGLFWHGLDGTPCQNKPGGLDAFEPAGFGVRHKTHPARRSLAGTVNQAFIDGDLPLPPDFDDAFWNAAPVDQQTGFLRGDETLELVNLCKPGTAGATRDARGNSWLTLTLMHDECFVLCRLRDGTLLEQALMLDTVLIEPEQHCVSLVWRGLLALDISTSARRAEIRMRSLEDGDLAGKERGSLRHQLDIAVAGLATPGVPYQRTKKE